MCVRVDVWAALETTFVGLKPLDCLGCCFGGGGRIEPIAKEKL